MRLKSITSRAKLLFLLCVAAIALHPAFAAGQTVTINLGQSAQNYVLTGTGSSTSQGATYGNYYNTQGSCATSGSTTTCDLTGNFTSSTSTFAAGTYDFQTVFTGSISTAVLSQTQYPVGSQEPNYFQYSGFSPSLTMTLKINVTGGGTYAIPLAANQNFVPGFDTLSFADVSAVCGGTSLGSDPCQQDYVGTVAGATYTGPVVGTVAFELPSPPVISPGTGSYTLAQSVTITAPTSGTTIYYTTDGSTPTSSSTLYNGAIAVSANETIQAVAIEADGVASPISSATYTFAVQTATPPPTFYPLAGTYTSAQDVALSDSATGAAIYYTTDGSTPTTSSTPYSTPIPVSSSETIKAIALATGDSASSVATAAYSIVANPLTENGDWEWVGGPSTDTTVAPTGVYGTKGQAAAGNIPGGRTGSETWVDATGNFWLFGGAGADVNGDESLLQDLWKYEPSTNEWTWVFGNNNYLLTTSDYGSYGTEGVASATNAPPTTEFATTWTDHLGNLWMYGGTGNQYATNNFANLSTLWEYDIATGEWTWINGQNNDASFVAPTYGTQGVAAAANSPGSRVGAAGWVDQQGNLWLFGGAGNTSTTVTGELNDLWEFNIATGQWTWIGGSQTFNSAGTYGTLGQASPSSVPAARQFTTTWTDTAGDFWLFGGSLDVDKSTVVTELNDLWKYNPTSNEWTWISGSDSTSGTTNGNVKGVASTASQPGSRLPASSWSDSYGNFWLFGGLGEDTTGANGYLNDLWMYNLATNVWTMEAGSTTLPAGKADIGAPGVYGTLGVPAPGNTPGGRSRAATWADKSGDLWLFGGAGADSTGATFHDLNDLWEYKFAATGAAVAPTVKVTPASSSITTTSALSVQIVVSGSGGTPTGSVTLASGSYTSAATSLASGAATIVIPANSLPAGTDTLTVTYTPNSESTAVYTSATGASTVTVTSPVIAVAPTVKVTPASSSITTTTALSVQVAVSGSGGTPTGSVTLTSGGYTSAATLLASGVATIVIPANSLPAGTDTLTVTYTPNSASTAAYTSATGTSTVTVTSPVTTVAPTVTVTPASTSITTVQSLSVAVSVSGTPACPALRKGPHANAAHPEACPGATAGTGSIVLSGAGYTSAAATLTNGTATINIPAGSLATGTDTLTATYTPDANSTSTFTAATGTASVNVTTAAVAPTVTVTPASSSITTAQTLSVTIAVTSPACTTARQGSVRPSATCGSNTVATGSVVLTSGSYTSAASTLVSGSAAITIPAGSLATGSDTLTATYTPDASSSSAFTSATGTSTVTVTQAVVSAPVASLSPGTLTFSATTGTTSVAQTATLSNTGNAALSITGITIAGTNASSFAETNTCDSSVAAGSSCTILIAFSPTSAGSLTATLNVADNAAGSPQAITLNGTGGAAPSFTVASTTPSASITPTSATATYQLVVTPQNGSFSSPVSLTATGLPSGYSAVFSPATVTPGSAAANVTMTVQPITATALLKIGAVPTLALLGMLFWPSRRRRRISLFLLGLVSIAATAALSGCGGGFNFKSGLQTYTITVSATGASQSQSTTVQLTVQQ